MVTVYESVEIKRIKDMRFKIENEVSSSACFSKWYHTNLHLQSGETHSCYHPAPHKIPLEELKNNPTALHNTMRKKLERKQMLLGDRPTGCEYCFKVEDLKLDAETNEPHISDRHIRNASIFTQERFDEAFKGPWDQNVNPEYLEISFGNECNFKCGYCHPKFSTMYYKEIEKFGPVTSVKNHRGDIDYLKLYQKEDENPYVTAFWEWWPELRKTLNIMRVTGGEPTLHKSTWQLLDRIDQEPMPWLELNINSNLGTKNILIERLSNKVKTLIEQNKIKSFKMFTSLDTWGTKAEYIRTGLDLEVWEKNFHTYLNIADSPITFMITFNIFSVTSFKSLLEKFLEWRRQYGWYENTKQHRIRFDTPYLHDPIQYDINILPKEQYMPYMREALQFMKDNLDDSRSDAFTTLEYEKFKRVVDYMSETIYSDEKLIEGRRDFYNWFNELDDRRETDLLSVYPEMTDFYRLCQEVNLTNPL